MIAVYARVRERALATDPELSRLHNATRSTLACLLTTALGIVWLIEHHAAVTHVALASLFAMIAPLFLRERDLSNWLVSLGLTYLCTCACFVIAATVTPHPFARDAFLLMLVFTGMLCHTLGTRATGCALLALVAFYLGFYLHPSHHQLAQMLTVSGLAPLVVTLVGRVLLPVKGAPMPWSSFAQAVSRIRRALSKNGGALATEVAQQCRARLLTELGNLARHRHHLAWRPASLACLAALLAMLIGQALSSERAMWAVISTFVVFLGTNSRESTLSRIAKRLAGTLAGAATSVLLVTTFNDEIWALALFMALSVFGWAYFIRHAYARGVFFITVLVGLIYGQLGFAIIPLAQLRIEEVITGCLIACALALLLMPSAARTTAMRA